MIRAAGGMAGVTAAAWMTFAAAAGMSPESGAGGTIPDAAQMAALRQQASAAPMFRVVGPFGARVIRRPLLDSTGVGSADWARGTGALFVAENTPPETVPRTIPWSEISQVQTGRTHAGRGALIGALCATFIDVTLFLVSIDKRGQIEWSPALSVATGIIAAGPFVGAAIGASHGSWRNAYTAGAGMAP